MSSSFLFNLTLTWLAFILVVECIYYPYLYDDTQGGQEHCCLVRVREKFCKATPITRSLIQVTKQCSRFGRKNHDYLDQITQRLNVGKMYENDEKIFLELEKPLPQNILENDLICLKSNQPNRIDFDQCHLEMMDGGIKERKSSRNSFSFSKIIVRAILERSKHQVRDRSSNKIKRSFLKSEQEKNDSSVRRDNEREIHRIELSEPIRIREGRGLSFFKYYQIKPDQIRPETSDQRRCWSWYRDRTRKLRRNASKSSTVCMSLNTRREGCLNQLIPNSINQIKHKSLTDSKLFCKTESNQEKFLGQYKNGKICFDQDNRVSIEYKFHDIAHLSDQYKNEETLAFLDQHKKLRAEFEDDCFGKRNLVENDEAEILNSSKHFQRN